MSYDRFPMTMFMERGVRRGGGAKPIWTDVIRDDCDKIRSVSTSVTVHAIWRMAEDSGGVRGRPIDSLDETLPRQ